MENLLLTQLNLLYKIYTQIKNIALNFINIPQQNADQYRAFYNEKLRFL